MTDQLAYSPCFPRHPSMDYVMEWVTKDSDPTRAGSSHPSCTLVLTGPPGCGKSVMLAMLADSIRACAKDEKAENQVGSTCGCQVLISVICGQDDPSNAGCQFFVEELVKAAKQAKLMSRDEPSWSPTLSSSEQLAYCFAAMHDYTKQPGKSLSRGNHYCILVDGLDNSPGMKDLFNSIRVLESIPPFIRLILTTQTDPYSVWPVLFASPKSGMGHRLQYYKQLGMGHRLQYYKQLGVCYDLIGGEHRITPLDYTNSDVERHNDWIGKCIELCLQRLVKNMNPAESKLQHHGEESLQHWWKPLCAKLKQMAGLSLLYATRLVMMLETMDVEEIEGYRKSALAAASRGAKEAFPLIILESKLKHIVQPGMDIYWHGQFFKRWSTLQHYLPIRLLLNVLADVNLEWNHTSTEFYSLLMECNTVDGSLYQVEAERAFHALQPFVMMGTNSMISLIHPSLRRWLADRGIHRFVVHPVEGIIKFKVHQFFKSARHFIIGSQPVADGSPTTHVPLFLNKTLQDTLRMLPPAYWYKLGVPPSHYQASSSFASAAQAISRLFQAFYNTTSAGAQIMSRFRCQVLLGLEMGRIDGQDEKAAKQPQHQVGLGWWDEALLVYAQGDLIQRWKCKPQPMDSCPTTPFACLVAEWAAISPWRWTKVRMDAALDYYTRATAANNRYESYTGVTVAPMPAVQCAGKVVMRCMISAVNGQPVKGLSLKNKTWTHDDMLNEDVATIIYRAMQSLDHRSSISVTVTSRSGDYLEEKTIVLNKQKNNCSFTWL